jgi:chromate transport protein ChrA
MDVARRSSARRTSSYVLEVVAAVALCYFVFGGSAWSPGAWAIFCVLAVAIVVAQVLYDTGNQSHLENSSWRLRLAFVLVAGLLVAAVWHQSLWLVGLGLVLGWSWFDELRAHRAKK